MTKKGITYYIKIFSVQYLLLYIRQNVLIWGQGTQRNNKNTSVLSFGRIDNRFWVMGIGCSSRRFVMQPQIWCHGSLSEWSMHVCGAACCNQCVCNACWQHRIIACIVDDGIYRWIGLAHLSAHVKSHIYRYLPTVNAPCLHPPTIQCVLWLSFHNYWVVVTMIHFIR